MDQKWIPFSERERLLEVSEGAVVNHLALPVGVDEDRLQVNPERIERLGRLAGAKQTHLILYDRGSDQDDFSFDGETQSDGTLIMTGLQHKKKKYTTNASYDDSNHALKDIIEELEIHIRANLTEAQDDEEVSSNRLVKMYQGMYKADAVGIYLPRRASEELVREKGANGRGILDEKAWAHTLDRGIRSGMVNAAFGRYTEVGPPWLLLHEMAWKTTVGLDLMRGDYLLPSIVLGYTTARRMAQAYRVRTGQVPFSDFNPSIMLNMRIDRYFATATAAKLGGKVIRYAA